VVKKGHAVRLPSGAVAATLVLLVGNSTVGQQTALTVAAGIVLLDVSEMPSIILLGVSPTPPSGPVPPIAPPTSPLCVPGDVGLFCLNSTEGDDRFMRGMVHEPQQPLIV